MVDSVASLAKAVAQSINSAGVPCLLWGHCLLNVHGVPSIIASIDFVVPDDGLAASATKLTQLPGCKQCADLEGCPSSSRDRLTPPPAFHVHLTRSELPVEIHLQSKTLWFLPRIDSKLAFPRKYKHQLPEPFVLATDCDSLPLWRPGRGSGAFSSTSEESRPVIVPRSHILLEAFMRLYARDYGTRIGSFALSMIGYMEEYVDEDGYLDIEKLPEPLKKYYLDLRTGEKPVRQWTLEFRRSLGILGPDSDSDDD
ncbi:hypothetical protein NLU13_5645 [Sarocladium strictum]|uniref:Thioredoxin reductase n=1 Tax=Sarocladium strictum TaxID=5046 RepID=A0AA39L7U6_SARSR|nr:hypothetical protein NLU13_5645 [Sarocladium strictum]